MPTNHHDDPPREDPDDEPAHAIRAVLEHRHTHATAIGIIMVIDDVDAREADARIAAHAELRHMDVHALADTICRTHRYP